MIADTVVLYPGTTPPALRVACIVGWNGREFRAVRLMHPRRKAPIWATFRDGVTVWLPPPREARVWGTAPDWWRPEHPETYPARLPPPLTSPPRRVLPQPVPPAPESATPGWWLDPASIVYAQPGLITRAQCEGRLMRAVSRAGAGQGFGFMSGHDGALLAAIADAVDQAMGGALGDDDALAPLVPRFEPVPADHDDWLVAMAWFAALDPPHLRHKRRRAWELTRAQRVLVWRSGTRPYTWADIGDWISRTGERARQIYGEAIDTAWRVANGV